MFHVIGTPIGVLAGVGLCYYAKKSKIVIGKPYERSDWLMVNTTITIVLIFAMIIEWSIYLTILDTCGESGESNVIVFLMKKGCLVPVYSCGLSFLWGKLVRKRYLDYAEGYSLKTAQHCLSITVAVVCFNVQYILLPGINDVRQYDFMQDSVIAWALMGIGTIFAFGAGCEGRRYKKDSVSAGGSGYIVPVLTTVGIGAFGLIASILGLAFLVPSFMVAATLTSLVLVLIVRLRRITLKRLERRLRKANKQGYTRRKYSAVFKGIQFSLDGEWLIIERDSTVMYRGNNLEFDALFGYEKHRIGTQISVVRSILESRSAKQLEFIDQESKRAIQFPDEYPAANERFAGLSR